MPVNRLVFVPFLLAAVATFCFACYRRLQLVSLGEPAGRTDRPVERVAGLLTYAFGQKRVLARPYGVNHLFLFWAFIILLAANTLFLLEGLWPTLSLAALPAALRGPLEMIFDLASLAALTCVAIALIRRLFFAPDCLATSYTSARSTEALLILSLIALLMVAYFLLNGARLALGIGEGRPPVSALVAGLLRGLSPAALNDLATVSWWVHAAVLLGFLNLLPRSKHMHILAAIPNIYLRNLGHPAVTPREEFRLGGRFGVGEVTRFTAKDLLDTFSCTECGRCQDVCPAHGTGKSLNPRRVVHDIKENLIANGAVLKSGAAAALPLVGEPGDGTVGEEALWSCTTCGACLAVCPVLIEQMPKVVKMRRHLVQEEARFPEELLNLFENMEQRANPWGIAPAERSKWASSLGERSFKPGETEYLFFVGCAGAFDNRAKQVSVALSLVLDRAGVSWGMLGREELCCGDSVRRLGNEYLFDKLARENVATLQKMGVAKIVTACPHCFSTLANDYRAYGLEAEVLHHSELLARLVASGQLSVPAAADPGKTVFHDSCYLGRHNGVYQAPRDVIAAATGTAPEEFGRRGENAFCCGAGGGRMWLEEQGGSRINHERVKEALGKKPQTVCVSCPYCMTMMEDGLKDLGELGVHVRDIAEVVAEACAP